MTAASFHPTHLRFNPHETLADFQARQRHAYAAGKAAWREGRINGQALQLYEELVRYVGGNLYAWVKEETLAAALGRSVSTIKRWMQQLVQAHLIRRGRRFGATSLTSITAYDLRGAAQDDAWDEAQLPAPIAGQTTGDPAATQAAAPDVAGGDVEASAEDVPEDVEGGRYTAPELLRASVPAAAQPARFFEPRSEPSISSLVRRDSIRINNLTPAGGGTGILRTSAQIAAETETTARLKEEGIVDKMVLNELHDRPLAQVETVIRYVAHSRTSDDPRRPGLIVHLLRRGFGARPSRTAGDSGVPPCAGRHRAVPRIDEALDDKPCSAVAVPTEQAGSGTLTEPVDTVLDAAWCHTLDQLAAQLDHEAYATWIAPNRPLFLEDDTVVVGTPNVFVRDVLEQQYLPAIAAGLSQSYGRPLTAAVVIGTTP